MHRRPASSTASTKLAAGTPVTVPVTITNTGSRAEDFFVDPRLATHETVTLAPFSQASGLSLPLVVGLPQMVHPDRDVKHRGCGDCLVAHNVRLRTNQLEIPDLAIRPAARPRPDRTPLLEIGSRPGSGSRRPLSVDPIHRELRRNGQHGDEATDQDLRHRHDVQTGDLEPAAVNPATTFSPVVIGPGQRARSTSPLRPLEVRDSGDGDALRRRLPDERTTVWSAGGP